MKRDGEATRRRLLAWLEGHPGARLSDVAAFLDVTRTAAVYHVRQLERSGHVRVVVARRQRLHFANHAHPETQDLLGLLRLERARQIVEALREDPTLSWRRLAKQLGVTPKAIRWQIGRLEDEGLLEVRDQGDRHRVRLHPVVARELEAQAVATARP